MCFTMSEKGGTYVTDFLFSPPLFTDDSETIRMHKGFEELILQSPQLSIVHKTSLRALL